MNIDVYASAQTIGQKESRRTACAVVLVATHPDGRVQVRKMMFPAGNSTVNLAGLHAARLAVAAIRPWARDGRYRAVVHTDSAYAVEMLASDGGSYKADPKTNVEAVMAMRQAFVAGPSLEHSRFADGIGAECVSLARAAASSQAPGDSGTKEFPDVREAGLQGEAR